MTSIETSPLPQPSGTPRAPSPGEVLRAAGHLGVGSAAGHALAASLATAAVLARSKAVELAERMRAEARAIHDVHVHTGQLNTEHWISESGRAFRKQLERHRDSIHTRAAQADSIALEIIAAGEELASQLSLQSQAIRIAATTVDTLLGSLTNAAADAIEAIDPGDIIARSGIMRTQYTLDSLIHVNLPEGLNALLHG